MLLLVAACAVVAAGCTVPGSSHLQGPPDGLPPSLDLVTADVLGYTLYDTDPASRRWSGLGKETAQALLEAQHAGLTGGFAATLSDVEPWIGDATGTALREFDLDGKTDTSTLYYADVRSRPKLESFLDDNGWTKARSGDLASPGDDAALWTHDSSCDDTPSGSQAICAAPEHVAYEAAAVTDDAIVAARSTKALKSLLDAADEYAVPSRKAMSEFTVEAAGKVPVAFVFRSDLLRTQVRRPFEDDPALLEFARWATDSNVLVALRDGWVGFAPALETSRRDDAVRLVGAAEWVPDLAPDITLGPANADLLGNLGPDVDVAVAFDDPGQHIRELVRAITFGSGQYVTEGDVPDDDRLELQPLLDRLDGTAAVGYGDYQGVAGRGDTGKGIKVVFEDPDDLRSDVTEALAHANVTALQGAEGRDVGSVTIDVPPIRPHDTKLSIKLARKSVPDSEFSKRAISPRDFTGAGKPPRVPFAWIWTSGRGCVGNTAGWLTFDGTDRITLGMDLELHGAHVAGEEHATLAECATSFDLPSVKGN
ncbi:MAG: hypothetical protein JWL76_1186 [Thermoleophilia bacterium]|nr:hypothetical protein [Thermoleophilia bacterium]